MILFSAKISEKHRVKLEEEFTNQKFIFCESIVEAESHLKDAEVFVTYGDDITVELVPTPTQTKMDCLPLGWGGWFSV